MNDTPSLHTVDIPVRWSDLDADGRVNNLVALRFAEEARMQWAFALQLNVEAPGLMPVVASVGCTYHLPMGYPLVARVDIHCTRIGRSSMDLSFRLVDASNPSLCFATASAVWVWVDKASGRSVAVPASLRARCDSPGPG